MQTHKDTPDSTHDKMAITAPEARECAPASQPIRAMEIAAGDLGPAGRTGFSRTLFVEPLPVVVAGFYPPPAGGESIHVSKLSDHLEKHGLLRARLNLNRFSPPQKRQFPAGGPVGLPRSLLRHVQTDTLLHLHPHGHSWRSWVVAAFGALALQRSGARGVLTLHSGLAPAYLRQHPAMYGVVVRVLAGFQRIICVNSEISDSLRDLGVASECLRVIPAFVPGRPRPPARTELARVKDFGPLILAIVGTGPEYGLDLLLDALPRLRAAHPDLCCLVVGNAGADLLPGRLAGNGLSRSVRFLGTLSHERCLGWIARADLLVRPSLADGDALSVREGLALGVPVVASNTGHRPAGTHLFRVGDSTDLVQQMHAALAPGSASRPIPQPDFLRQVLDVYREASGSRWN